MNLLRCWCRELQYMFDELLAKIGIGGRLWLLFLRFGR